MCSVRKVFLKISQNLLENTCVRVSFLVKLQAEACNFIKYETLAQVFSCEFCETFENTVFYRIPSVAASEKMCYTSREIILLVKQSSSQANCFRS